MPIYTYETEDGELLEMSMTISEMVERTVDGVITLDDGRKASRNIAADMRQPRGDGQNVEDDHSSMALAVDPSEIRATQERDKKYYGQDAPDCYSDDGVPHWRGPIGSVIRRKEAYTQKQGFAWKI